MKQSRAWAAGVVLAAVALAAHAAGRPLAPGEMATRVSRGQPGQELTGPSSADPASIVGTFLRQSGRSDATVRSLSVTGVSRQFHRDRKHIRMTQQIGGLQVSGAYVKATVDRQGRLLSVIENVVGVPNGAIPKASIDEVAALRTALGALHLATNVPAVSQRRGVTTSFAKGTFFYQDPTVTRVAIPTDDGGLAEGYLVQTWTLDGNLLYQTLVAGAGEVVDVELRTDSDSYNVFPVDPDKTPQQVVAGPGGTTWLFAGDHRTIDIAGNNVHAYLDTVNDGVPDPGGSTVSDGNFLAIFDPTIQPTVDPNPAVAVQNLFYLNNVLHDRLYGYGFDEAAGNFQEDNFGNGGRGGDSVRAEAQDGGSLDNANFATPPDGFRPRMQMYLWTSPDPDHEVVVNSPGSIAGSYGARGAVFGPHLDATGVTGDVAFVTDGGGPGTPTDGCETFVTDVSGKIALVDRGACNFTVKVKNAQNGGAIGVIVVQNLNDPPFTMGGSDATITIPSVMISKADGATIRTEATVNATIRLVDPPPIMLDGDLDSDIVYHEYGHGLTWRMIGEMDGPMSGAIGEGMSDVLAILFNDDDTVGEYATGDPNGVRTQPYTGYPRTYGDFTGLEVHFDGEIYGAIGWHLWELFQAAGASVDELLGYIVDGMNYTRSRPTFEDMRDGILAAASGTGRECLIWQAFADFGVGVGAHGAGANSVRNTGNTPFPVQPPIPIFESFAVPDDCP